MKKVTTINLGGNAYQLEETGYQRLQAYFDEAARRLQHNPDKDEILADIETAMAEKFRAALGPHKSVVLTAEVEAMIAAMGPVEDDQPASPAGESAAAGPAVEPDASGGAAKPEAAGATGGPARRLYKIPDGAMLAGVCSGIAAYLGLDVLLVRLVFASFGIAMLALGLVAAWFVLVPVLIYGGLAALLPAARTPEERAAARGDPATAEEFIRRARDGYYQSMRTLQDPVARREWKRRVKREVDGWRQAFQGEARHDGERASYEATRPGRAWRHVRPMAPAFALPFLGFVEAALVLFGLVTGLLLLTKGQAFGVALPPDVPLWVGLVALVVALHVVTWPLKAMRHAWYVGATGRGGPRPSPAFVGFWDSLVWLAVAIAGLWLADHYFPPVHAFFMQMPDHVREVASAFKHWWAGL